MNKKNLAIIIASSVALALIVGAIIFIVTQEKQSDQDKSPYRFEEFEHMGVAQLVSKSDVEEAIKGIGSGVRGPEASGTLYLDGVKSETSSFKFTVDDQEVQLDIDVKVYQEGQEADEELKPDNVFRATEGDAVDGVGETAYMYFPTGSASGGERQYSLIALEGRSILVISLTFPSSSEVLLSRTAGEQILQSLGSKMDLGNIK